MPERIVAEQLSRFGSMRVVISLTDARIDVERWHRGPRTSEQAALTLDEIAELRTLALAVSQDEQALVKGDFYADGEERLRIELRDHAVELHNDSDRIMTPAARPLLERCYAIGSRLLPPRKADD